MGSWLKKELEISGYKDKDKIKKEDKDRYKDVVDFHRFTGNRIEFKNIICQNHGITNKFVLICG